MAEAAPALTFVIPVKNGASFLTESLHRVWEWLAGSQRRAELLVVDDGSDDRTPVLLDEFAAGIGTHERLAFRCLRNARNRGKGFSLRRAFLHARGEMIVFTDADLTYPVENVTGLLDALEAGADVAIGSRMHADSRYVVAPTFFGKLFTRHISGRVFNLFVRLLVPGVRDSQAGLKGFRRDAARALAERVRLDRFSFDVEMLFVTRRLALRLVECPVLFVYRKEPSTVHFAFDSLSMLRDMLRIRWRGWRGVYDRPADPERLADLLNGGSEQQWRAAGAIPVPGLAATDRQHDRQDIGRTG
ncbi:MAG TPA: glycosyltransferase [Planctomycetota bacterium]|nr:glycosyltransferase [Planctomycetota bacterium]